MMLPHPSTVGDPLNSSARLAIEGITNTPAPLRNVLGIAGSLRRGSYNASLIKAANCYAPNGMSVRAYEELSSIPLFNEDLDLATAGGPESVQRLRALVSDASGVLIATPEYNQSVPGVLKNAIDWLSTDPGSVLTGKPVAVIGATSGPWGTRISQSVLRHVLFATGSLVMGQPALYIRDAGRVFDDAGRMVDPATRERLEVVLAAFVRWIDIVTGTR